MNEMTEEEQEIFEGIAKGRARLMKAKRMTELNREMEKCLSQGKNYQNLLSEFIKLQRDYWKYDRK